MEGAVSGQPFTFQCDTSRAGLGEVKLDIVHSGRSLQHKLIKLGDGMYNVSFLPQDGKHRIYVYFNGVEVKGENKDLFS